MNRVQPLLVFDTNMLMELWLGRDGSEAVLLVDLVEKGRAELVIPEYVLFEFRGTALKWLREQRSRLDQDVRSAANEWERSAKLDDGARKIREGAQQIAEAHENLERAVDEVVQRIRDVSRVETHTSEVHFRGDLRFLSGRPPDRAVDGLKDCRIYEAILAIARSEKEKHRLKYVVTRDKDFDFSELRDELRGFQFELRNDPGKLYGELRPRST